MKRVLVIEDEEPIRTIIARNLEQRGYQVAEAATAAEGVASCCQQHPDVIVLDINLPDGSGWDVLRGLAAKQLPRPAILALSAAPPARSRLDEFAPITFLPKPFLIHALLRGVDRLADEVGSHEPLDRSAV